MKSVKIVYWQEADGVWLGYLESHPDYMTQGETLEELKGNLRDIYDAPPPQDLITPRSTGSQSGNNGQPSLQGRVDTGLRSADNNRNNWNNRGFRAVVVHASLCIVPTSIGRRWLAAAPRFTREMARPGPGRRWADGLTAGI